MTSSKRRLPSWSPELARVALAGHSVLGLSLGALLYLVCLTGALSVFGDELRSWEAPFDERLDELSPEQADRLLRSLVGDPSVTRYTDIILGFPTGERPYGMVFLFDEEGRVRRAIGEGNEMSPVLRTPWTDMLEQLHADLHVPVIGSIIVGILGLLLMSSLVTGLIAHRKIFLDAFFIRRSGSPRLFQADIHNRLGAWALPFHLLIALTGAFLALTPALVPVAAWYGYGESADELSEVYNGRFPASTSVPGTLPDLTSILDRMEQIAPSERVEYVTIHDPGLPVQSIDLETDVFPQLAYAEVHRFDGNGEYLGSRHYTDGPPGLQFFAASGSLHFGTFSMLGVRIVYGLLGLALTVCCATGMNMWFRSAVAKGRPVALLDRMWRAVLWGVPLGLGVSCLASVVNDTRLATWFYVTLAIVLLAALFRLSTVFYDRLLRGALGVSATVVALVFTFSPSGSPGPLNAIVGLAFLITGLVVLFSVPFVRSAVGGSKLSAAEMSSSRHRADGR